MSEGTEEAPAGVPPELPGEVVDDSTMLSYVRQALGDILDILGGSKKAGEVVQACEAALKRVQALEAESTPEERSDASPFFHALYLAAQKEHPFRVQLIVLSTLQKLFAYNYIDGNRILDAEMFPLPGQVTLDPVPRDDPLAIPPHSESEEASPADADEASSQDPAQETTAAAASVDSSRQQDTEASETAAAEELSAPAPEQRLRSSAEVEPRDVELVPSGRALIHVIVQLLYECSMREHEPLRLQTINCVLTLVTAPHSIVHGNALLLCMRTCYHIFLVSRDNVNRMTAKAALTQILNLANQRMDAGVSEHREALQRFQEFQARSRAAEADEAEDARVLEETEELLLDGDTGPPPQVMQISPTHQQQQQSLQLPLSRESLQDPSTAAGVIPEPPVAPIVPSPKSGNRKDGLGDTPGSPKQPQPVSGSGQKDSRVQSSSGSQRGKYGNCVVCRKPAERYCLQTLDPVCGRTCKQSHIQRLFGTSSSTLRMNLKTLSGGVGRVDEAGDASKGSSVGDAAGEEKHSEDPTVAGEPCKAELDFLREQSEVLQQDLYVLLSALCKLSAKPLQSGAGGGGGGGMVGGGIRSGSPGSSGSGDGGDPESVPLRTKILSLELLLGLLQNAGPALRDGPQFIGLVQQSLVMSLLHNAVTPVESIFRLSSSIFLVIVEHFKAHLRNEIGVFLESIFLRILASPNSSYSHKTMALTVFSKFCQDPQTIVDIFVNYDCEFDSFNIFASTMTQLEKIAQGRFSNDNLLTPEQQSSLQLVALQTVVSILRSLVLWTRKARQELAERSGEEGEVDADRLLDEDAAKQTAVDKVLGRVSRESMSQSSGTGDSQTSGGEESSPRGSLSSAGSPSHHRRSMTTNLFTASMGPAERKGLKQRMELGISKFNIKASKGLKFLWNEGLLEKTPEAVAQFFLQTPGLNKRQIGDYMGEDLTFNKEVLYRYVEAHDFPNITIDEAIRTFLQGFRLPGEAQKIDRMMEKFAEQYCLSNTGVFSNADTAYILAYSIIMLNTDAHSPMVKRKMTLEQFIRQNRGIDDGQDLEESFLTDIYFRIVNNEIRLNDEHVRTAGGGTDRTSRPKHGSQQSGTGRSTGSPSGVSGSGDGAGVAGGAALLGSPGADHHQRSMLFQQESADMMQRTRRMIAGGRGSDGRSPSSAGGALGAFGNLGHVEGLAGETGLDAALAGRLGFYSATHADFEAVQPMFEQVWPAALATFSQLMAGISNSAGGGLSLATLLATGSSAANKVLYPHHSQQQLLPQHRKASAGTTGPEADEEEMEEEDEDRHITAEHRGSESERRRSSVHVGPSTLLRQQDIVTSSMVIPTDTSGSGKDTESASTDQLRIIGLCLDGYRYAIRVANVFNMETPRVAFMNSLTNLTLLVDHHSRAPPAGGLGTDADERFQQQQQQQQQSGNQRYLGIKNIASFKMLLKITYSEGNQLRGSWKNVFQSISEYSRLAHGTQDFAALLRAAAQTPPAGGGRGPVHTAPQPQSSGIVGFFGGLFGPGNTDSEDAARNPDSPVNTGGMPGAVAGGEVTHPVDAANAVLLQHTIDPAWVEKVFTLSSKLNSDAIVDFVDCLRMVSEEELAPVEKPRVFCLQKLVEVTSYNMEDRIRLVWSRIWSLLSPYFVRAGCHPNLHVCMYACDSLRQLAMKFLEKDELTHYQFQKQFLQPFEEIMRRNSENHQIRELIIAMVEQLIHSRFHQLNSGWKSIFIVLSEAAHDTHFPLVKSAFGLLVQLLEKYFDCITANFQIDECINCLVAFACNTQAAGDSSPQQQQQQQQMQMQKSGREKVSASDSGSGSTDIALRAIGMLVKCSEWLADVSRQHRARQESPSHPSPDPSSSSSSSSSSFATEASVVADGSAEESVEKLPNGILPSIPAVDSEPSTPQRRRRPSLHQMKRTQSEEDHLRIWFLLLTGFSRMVGDHRLAVRSRALQALFRTLHKHGGLFSQDTWGFIFRGVLFPMFDDVQHTQDDLVAPIRLNRSRRASSVAGTPQATPPRTRPQSRRGSQTNQSELLGTVEGPEEEPSWLQSTCFVALSTLVQLFCEYYAEVRFLLPELLNLLNSCIDSPTSLPLSRIGIQCWAHLIQQLSGVHPQQRNRSQPPGGGGVEESKHSSSSSASGHRKLSREDWKVILDALRRVTLKSLPQALFSGEAPQVRGAGRRNVAAWAAELPQKLRSQLGKAAVLDGRDLELLHSLGLRNTPPPPAPQAAAAAAAVAVSPIAIPQDAQRTQKILLTPALLQPAEIVAQCKIQLMLMDAVEMVFGQVWSILQSSEVEVDLVLHLLTTFGISIGFAQQFNEASLYRKQLWDAGFMKGRQKSPPELFYQEARGVQLCMKLLLGLQSHHSELILSAAGAVLLEASLNLGNAMLRQYVELRQELLDHISSGKTAPVELEGRLRCLERPLIQLLIALSTPETFSKDFLLRVLPSFYPHLVRLVNVGSPSVRAEVADFLGRGLIQVLPFDT